jgi:hypothetical protein
MKKLILAVVVTGLLLLIISNVTKASNTVELQRVDLKTKTQEIEIKTQKSLELQKQLENAHGDLEKLKSIEQENKKLQDEISRLQAIKAEKARIAEVERKSLADRVLNTQKASASGGNCESWKAQAGIPSTNATRTLISNESGCRFNAVNPSSGACGIPQAYPCSKLPCPLNESGAVCQLQWMQNYVMKRYGSWEQALSFWYSQSPHWY